ncbi:MAG: hypothetical protein WDM96_02065 [Lacunisphaera sp.]
MSSIKSTGLSEEKFAPWLRRESLRALKLSLILLAIGSLAAWGVTNLSTAVANQWSAFNYQLTKVALDQHPLALARSFASRLQDSEYGWKPIGLSAPFNVTVARQRLRREFPEVAAVVDGTPQVPRGAALKKADPVKYEQRLAAFMERYQRIESGRFANLYDQDDIFSVPNANAKLGMFATKIFGLVDAFFYVGSTFFVNGGASLVLFATVLALSAAPLWRSRRPARTWLKIIVWPMLASTLVWGAIFFMALAAATLGGITPDTSALALLATLPVLSLLAKLPLHLAETLVTKTPAKWDGVDRRKPRPASTNTVPPLGGA